MAGETAVVDPVSAVPTNNVDTPQTDGAQAEVKEDLATKNAVLEERLKHSTEQGVRVAEDLKELKEKFASLEKSSSLKTQPSNEQGFVSREQYVKHWTENGDKTEKEANAEYERESFLIGSIRQLQNQNSAIQNILRFESEQREKGLISVSSEAKEADEFFKAVPEMDALPTTTKIEALKTIKSKLVPEVKGRDLSAVKGAAGSVIGSSSKSVSSSISSDDEAARKAGFPSNQAMVEATKCTTQAEYAAWKTKWKQK